MTANATQAIRIATHDRVYLVVDALPESVVADVLTETTLADLASMFRGGLQASRHPTVYTARADAERDARARLGALNADGD